MRPVVLVHFMLSVSASHVAHGAEIKVFSGSGVQPVMAELVPEFERSSGHAVIFEYGTIGGMAERVQSGERADVLIASEPQVAALEREGKIIAGTATPLAKTGIGIFVRKGAPKPDIGSVEAFKSAMLAAKSIGWNDPAAGAPVSIHACCVREIGDRARYDGQNRRVHASLGAICGNCQRRC